MSRRSKVRVLQRPVVRFEQDREVAWKIKENGSTWSFTLEPSGSGTRLVQRREAPNGLSSVSSR